MKKNEKKTVLFRNSLNNLITKMSQTVVDILQKYSITGNPTLDAMILAALVPTIVSHITNICIIIWAFVKEYIINYLLNIYRNAKIRLIGSVEFRLCVFQEKNIYPTIKSIFFSPELESDNIDMKTVNMLDLITDGTRKKKYRYDDSDDIYDLSMDDSNNITIEKRIECGDETAVTKKYFIFHNYYIVVSENNKLDFIAYYAYKEKKILDESNKKDDGTKKDDTKKEDATEKFILFEAIKKDKKFPTDNEIVKKFIFERFKLVDRTPFKYVMKIKNKNIRTILYSVDSYKNSDSNAAELMISDGMENFLQNPKVREFYGHNKKFAVTEIDQAQISSSLVIEYSSNIFRIDNINTNLAVLDDCTQETDSNHLFTANFKSIMRYFFGNKYKYDRYYFYLRENKIIMFFYEAGSIGEYYIAVISFQEFLTKEKTINILTELVQANSMAKSSDNEDTIKIYTYKNGCWNSTKCESRSYKTIYLTEKTKELVTSEMEKFMCFEKIYKENGIPYKKGFLFYGPPGTGKTSLVKALANQFNIAVYIFDINDGSINDENICSTINSISGEGNRILLFEDIDSAFAAKEELKYQQRLDDINETPASTSTGTTDKNVAKKNNNKKFLTYSGLLNALDGVLSGQNGTIVIMTTNYYEKLGPALIRPGRIDLCLELSFCDRYQLIMMTENMIKNSYAIIAREAKNKITFYNPYTSDELNYNVKMFADNIIGKKSLSCVKPCELQTYILKYVNNLELLFSSYQELLDKAI
jgi:hypothetical protein